MEEEMKALRVLCEEKDEEIVVIQENCLKNLQKMDEEMKALRQLCDEEKEEKEEEIRSSQVTDYYRKISNLLNTRIGSNIQDPNLTITGNPFLTYNKYY